MSGIVGLLHNDRRPVAPDDLQRMLAAVAHRGPDGAGRWLHEHVGLGHQALWTTSESRGERMPAVSEPDPIVITADVRIDNRSDLLAQLGADSDTSDSGLIVAAYRRWGERCPEYLVGDFAFAIWDGRRHQLFCARDHFGVKPFYYYAADGTFAFGSEIKALLALPEVPHRLNEARVAEHLAGLSGDTTATWYTTILRLAPGHSLCANAGGVVVRGYWALDPDRAFEGRSDRVYVEEFLSRFTEAVRCRLRSGQPVGSMLSGGLDSSAITCVARDILQSSGDGLHTFSALHDTVKRSDERHFIEAVLAQSKLTPHLVDADSISPLVDYDQLLNYADEPVAAGNLYINWSLYKCARQGHVRVLLDGFDGDTTVSHGSAYLFELAHQHRWLALAREVRAQRMRLGQPWRPAVWSWLWVYGIDPLVEGSRVGRHARHIQRQLRPVPAGRSQFDPHWHLNPELVRATDLDHRGDDNAPRTEREHHYRRLTDPVLATTLEQLDHAAAPFGIELRFPFWDKRLAEFCLALPGDQKLRAGWTRSILRRAMTGILPREVQWRTDKADLSHSFNHGLRHFERERLAQVFETSSGQLDRYVNLPAVRAAYERFLEQTSTGNDDFAVWRTMSLALWLQHAGFSS